MANGLLSNIFGAIDSAKRGVSNRYNMLMDNPREYLAQIEERARESNRVQQAGIPGLLAQYTGAPVTPEQQRAAQYANQQMMDVAMGFTGNVKPAGLLGTEAKNIGGMGLPSPQSLTMPSVPTVEQMKKYGRTEVVPLSKSVSFQSKRNWEKFNAGKHPGDLVPGFGDKPLALRLETGEYVIYDGNHRTDLALKKGKTELPMHVIDVKSYDPAHAGRKPVPSKISDDELLNMLLGK